VKGGEGEKERGKGEEEEEKEPGQGEKETIQGKEEVWLQVAEELQHTDMEQRERSSDGGVRQRLLELQHLCGKRGEKTCEGGVRMLGVERETMWGSGIPRWRGGSGRRGRKREEREEARLQHTAEACRSFLPLRKTAKERHRAPRARRQVVFSEFFFFRFYLSFRAPCSWPHVRCGASGLE